MVSTIQRFRWVRIPGQIKLRFFLKKSTCFRDSDGVALTTGYVKIRYCVDYLPVCLFGLVVRMHDCKYGDFDGFESRVRSN